MKRYCILLFLLTFLLSGCITVLPAQTTGSTETETTDTTESTESVPSTGWVTEAAQTFYVNQDGSRHTGWLELNGTRYYLDAQGVLQTGWLELDGQEYYLKADGSITRGAATIDQRVHYFTSAGVKVIVANPWNIIPSDYKPELVSAEDGYLVDSSCRDALMQMLSDCRNAGHGVKIISAYRKHQTQIDLYNRKVWYYIDRGYNEADARKEAGTIVAVPGTSEHELGLALDLVDASYRGLDEAQEDTAAQKWLMEHCWEYGFILRYPNGKSNSTGIIYEPWHYRYVGKELAQELQTSGLCLEEYFSTLH